MFPKRIIIAAFSISAAASCLLCGYEFIRAVSNSLFIEAYSADNLPRVMVAVPPSVLLILYIYGRLLSTFGATRTLAITSCLSAILILGCYFAIMNGLQFAAAVIYVFREVYIVLIIEQFWSFVNSTLNPKQAKTINGPFCAIASLGSVAGGLLVGRWATTLGSETFLIFTSASLIPAAFFGIIAYYFAGEPKPTLIEEGGKRGHLGVRTFFSFRYLVYIGLLILSTQIVSTVLDLRFNTLVDTDITEIDAMTSYYGNFYALLGAISAVLQLLVVPIALRLAPIRVIHIGIPIVHLINGFVLLFSPSLKTGKGAFAYLTFKAFDYSSFIQSRKRTILPVNIPLTYDERYRAKQIIDSFGYRFAKGGSAGVIELIRLVVTTIPGMAYALTAMVFSCVWGGLVMNLTKIYHKLEKGYINPEN